jgi:superfamily II DNA or RNA helicase
MKAVVTSNNRALRVVEYDTLEYEQLQKSFKVQIRDYHKKKRVLARTRPGWNGIYSFITNDMVIPIGLWGYLQKVCKQYGFPLHVEGMERIIDYNFDEAAFMQWVEEFFEHKCFWDEKTKRPDPAKPIRPHDYQIASAMAILKYRRSLLELATSAGKSLIFYMVFAYMKEKGLGQKMLVVVPNTNLVTQMEDNFEEYSEDPVRGNFEFVYQPIHAGTEKQRKKSDIVVGTYQSLSIMAMGRKENKKTGTPALDANKEFFSDFDFVGIDEAHHTQAKSIRDILGVCDLYKADYRFGMSGTMGMDDSSEALTIMGKVGPLVKKISPKYLIENKHATPVKIHVLNLSYMDEESREALYKIKATRQMGGLDLLNFEKNLVIENRPRLLFLCKSITKVPGNTLVLFNSVKNGLGYGKKLYDHLRDNYPDREVFYIDGKTKDDVREHYKRMMAQGKDIILIASFGTFSTGISIKNIENIWLVEDSKSTRIILQSIGRGMRLRDGKDRVNIFDCVDDFSCDVEGRSGAWGREKNALLQHGEDRIKIYEKAQFPYKVKTYEF